MIYTVIVRKGRCGYWMIRSGSIWVKLHGSKDMTLKDVREKIYTPMEDVRAHPNSVHYDEENRGPKR